MTQNNSLLHFLPLGGEGEAHTLTMVLHTLCVDIGRGASPEAIETEPSPARTSGPEHEIEPELLVETMNVEYIARQRAYSSFHNYASSVKDVFPSIFFVLGDTSQHLDHLVPL
jgi:hypothetical protein